VIGSWRRHYQKERNGVHFEILPGTTSAYTPTVALLFQRHDDTWRVWFFAGLIEGGLVAALIRGGPVVGFESGALGRVLC
jgi:hypothetical protein